MLRNGLGELLDRELSETKRFVDLFSGSGAVATHVATNYKVRVHAFDLQAFSAVVAEAFLARTTQLDAHSIWKPWLKRADRFAQKQDLPVFRTVSPRGVTLQRRWCAQQETLPITSAYGGHYFSAKQAVWIDALRKTLPRSDNGHTAALAALIVASSQSVAAPGHTAQPFQPTVSALPFLREAWERDIVQKVESNLGSICDVHAQLRGKAEQNDANIAARRLREGDLVFIDPPYSGVHYSRFYHVLESIACGECGEVSGIGRYPAPNKRPRSKYSLKTDSTSALDSLLATISGKGARAILTFPNHDCSNGLSGSTVLDIANKYFEIEEQRVKTRFSTLGGHKEKLKTKKGRTARRVADELILVLSPR